MSELGREARDLIELARDADDPSAEDRHRVRRRVAAAAAAAGVMAAALPAAKATTASSAAGAASAAAVTSTTKIAAMLLSGFAAGAVAAGTTVAWLDTPREPERPVPAAHAPTIAEASNPAAVVPPPAETERALAEPQALEPETAAQAPARVPRKEPPLLAQETQLLESARAALTQGDAKRALELASEHGRRFPRGALAAEAMVTRVLALCRLGDRAAARQSAARFLEAFPRSPLRPRVMSSCAAESSISETDEP